VRGSTVADFSTNDWAQLSTAERVRLCHAYAAEAERLATVQRGSLAENYLAVARQWLELAAELELHR